MNGRLSVAIAGLAIVLAASGSGGTAAAPAAPAYGVFGSIAGSQQLVRVDPVTLRPLASGLAISRDLSFGGRSPDGRSAAFFDYRRPLLRVVDLEGLKNRGDVVVAPAGWRARSAAWLTADRVAVVIQRMRGSYSQIVDRREVVTVDPFARRVLSRRQIAVATALTASASGGDKLVLLLGRGNARIRNVRVAVVDSSGAVRTVDVDLGPVQGLRLPALAVEPSGRRAFVVAAGAPVFEIDLEAMKATAHPAAAGAVLADATASSRQAVLLEGGVLAVTGSDSRRERGVEISRPAGLAFVDTSTWQARLVDPAVSGASISGDTLVGYSFRIERVQRGGRATQKVVGIGLRAYAADGTRRWQRFGVQPLTAYAFRQSALVYRHTSLGPSGFFVVDLADGRQIRANTGARQNVRLLPDVPDARPVRAPAAVRAEALQVKGTGEELRGTVQPEVTRVVAALVDGSERELTIEAGSITYRAATPHESARTVQAFAGDQLVASISLPVACGGSAGPCAQAAPATMAAAPATSAVTADPFTRVSNRGTRVEPKAEKRGEREMTPRDLFLLRRDEGRAVYRIGGLQPGYSSCYASGPANDIGRLGGINCGRDGFPSRLNPLQNMSAIQMRRGAKNPQLYRLEGVAVDAIAEIGLTDAGGGVIGRVPVRENVYVLARPPAAATGGLVAYDSKGEVVFRSERRRQPPAAPAPAANPRRLAGYRLKITLPQGWSGEIRRSSAGPGRALLFAGNRLPARDVRSVSLALTERDPRAQPPYQRIAKPPQLELTDISPVRSGQGRVDRSFTYEGRQFSLQLGLGTSRPSAAQLGEINRALATLSVGAIAVAPTAAAAGTPLQRGTGDGVSVDVYRSGIVRFRFDTASRLYRQLQGGQLSIACLTFDSVTPWESNESWFSNRTLAETVQVIVSDRTRPQPPYATVDPATEANPPFDGCLVSGSYGRRWNDPRGQHSPAEIAFTSDGSRFFDERAVARDLALFVRSPKLAAARRSQKQGAPASAGSALARGLPARVLVLGERRRLPAAGEIGVWSNRRDTIEVSARSSAGKRLFIELRNGRIAQHNLEGLAFVF
jgi:hypothetical protein